MVTPAPSRPPQFPSYPLSTYFHNRGAPLSRTDGVSTLSTTAPSHLHWTQIIEWMRTLFTAVSNVLSRLLMRFFPEIESSSEQPSPTTALEAISEVVHPTTSDRSWISQERPDVLESLIEAMEAFPQIPPSIITAFRTSADRPSCAEIIALIETQSMQECPQALLRVLHTAICTAFSPAFAERLQLDYLPHLPISMQEYIINSLDNYPEFNFSQLIALMAQDIHTCQTLKRIEEALSIILTSTPSENTCTRLTEISRIGWHQSFNRLSAPAKEAILMQLRTRGCFEDSLDLNDWIGNNPFAQESQAALQHYCSIIGV